MEAKKKHIEWIDLLRCLAICCVILTHVSQAIYPVSMSRIETASFSGKILAYLMIIIGRFGVPLFLMISGYLLLDREYDAARCKKFWKQNLLGLILTTEIWAIIYNIFVYFYTGTPIKPGHLIESMLFVRAVNMDYAPQLWYMPMLFGLYLFVPFLANALRKIDVKLLRIPSIVVAAYIFAVPAISAVMQTWGYEPVDSWLSLEFSGGIYGSILIAGYLLKKGALKKLKSSWLVVICLISAAVLLLHLYQAFEHKYDYQLWYNNIFILICTMCIFEWFSRLKNIFWKPVIQCLARCSFGIYLIHNMFVTLGLEYVNLAPTMKIPVVWLLTFTVSWLIVWVLSKNKVLARVLFFIRK